MVQTAGKGTIALTVFNFNYILRNRCTPSVDPAPSQEKAESAPPEKEPDGTIHCKVLNMKVKIDFNDKRSKFIQLLSMDDEDEDVQVKTNQDEDNPKETVKASLPAPSAESTVDEDEDKQENEFAENVSQTNSHCLQERP